MPIVGILILRRGSLHFTPVHYSLRIFVNNYSRQNTSEGFNNEAKIIKCKVDTLMQLSNLQ